MSWFSGVKALFSASEVVDNTFDKDNGLLTQFGGWIGNMNFTPEEMAKNSLEVMSLATERIKAMAPFKIMQRYMVTIIMVQWGFLGVNLVVAAWIEYLTGKVGIFDMLLDLAMTPFMWLPISGAVGLYLMGGVIPRKGETS